MTIIQVKVISGHQVKKVKPKTNRDIGPRYVFLGDIFVKNTENDPKTFLKRQNRSKNEIRKSRNDVKRACFGHVLCHNSAIFKISTSVEILYTYLTVIAV